MAASALLIAVQFVAFAPGALAAQPVAGQGQDCVIVLGEQTAASVDSPVIYESCSPSSAESAQDLNNARIASEDGGYVAAASSDLLMTWWADINYGGGKTTIYGSQGTCDSAGYRITPTSYWQVRISSITGGGQCDAVDVTSRSLTYADDFLLPVKYIGNTLNDNVGRIQVYNI